MPRLITALFTVLLTPCFVHAASTQPTTRPDPHLWAKRNVELIRQATTRNADPLESGGVSTTLGFSLQGNPLLTREPYAKQILKHADDALARDDLAPKVRKSLEATASTLRLPPEQRPA